MLLSDYFWSQLITKNYAISLASLKIIVHSHSKRITLSNHDWCYIWRHLVFWGILLDGVVFDPTWSLQLSNEIWFSGVGSFVGECRIILYCRLIPITRVKRVMFELRKLLSISLWSSPRAKVELCTYYLATYCCRPICQYKFGFPSIWYEISFIL